VNSHNIIDQSVESSFLQYKSGKLVKNLKCVSFAFMANLELESGENSGTRYLQ